MRSGGRVVLLACALAMATPATPATAALKRCAKPAIAVTRAGRVTCVRLPVGLDGAVVAGLVAHVRSSGARRTLVARALAAERKSRARARRASAAVPVGAPAGARMRALGGEHGTRSGSMADISEGQVPKGTYTQTATRHGDDEVGYLDDHEISVDADTGTKGVKGTVGMRQGSGALAKRCPDANGLVPARSHYALGRAVKVTADSGSLSVAFTMFGDVDVVAHVGDGARITGYDYKGFATSEIRVAGGRASKTDTYRVAISGRGLDPHARSEPTAAEVGAFFVKSSVYGPKGRMPWTDKRTRDALAEAYSVDSELRSQVAKALLQAERFWYDEYGCVEADVTPAEQQSSKGGSVTMHAVASAKADGAAIPSAHIDASTYEPWTTLSATSGTGTLDLTASDAGGQWQAERSLVVDFAVLSRRGRGRGQGVITVPGKPAVPLMHVHVTLKTEVPCDDARTSYATVDDATIDGDLTARSESTERNSAGSGRATGVSRIVMGDCGHVESYPQDDATNFTAAYLSDGTLSVSWVVDGMFMRWSYLGWTAPGNGTRTEDWTDDDGTRHHLTVTISDLRASTD